MDIKEDIKGTAVCKCKNAMQKLCSMKIRDSLDFKMSITCSEDDEMCDNECFTKTISSTSEFSLIKTLGAFMLIGGAISLICALCSISKKN